MSKFGLAATGVIIALTGIFIYQSFWGDNLQILTNLSQVSLTPTPMPFAEMTIPHLRQRSYQSSLADLKVFSENSNYTSYLTSYTSDGLKINGLLTKPKGQMPEGGWPAVIFIHGYIPPTQYITTQNYGDYLDYLARNGLVVFKIDLRGHGESEGEPGGAYYSSDYIIDALNAYSALESSNFVKKGSIGLWGHSMAGNVVMRALAAKPDIKAVVIWAGAVYTYLDFGEYGISDNSYRPPAVTTPRANRRQELFNAHGQFNSEHPFWKQVPATNYLSDIKGAIQIHHAVDDSVVDIGYSRNLDQILDKTSISHQLFEYQSGGHNLNGASFNAAMQRSVDFFRNYLK
jgi:uncharacterized protein